MDYFSPPFVTETNERFWTDCTWSSGLMLANKASANAVRPKGKYPPTRSEREALRIASGDRTGGSTLYDLSLGIKRRYNWTLQRPVIARTTFLRRLAVGYGAVVQGVYAVLPWYYQRWDRKFAAKGDQSLHAMYVQAHDRKGIMHLDANGLPEMLFYMDPLGRGTYNGEWIPTNDIIRFMRALWDSNWLAPAMMKQGSVK